MRLHLVLFAALLLLPLASAAEPRLSVDIREREKYAKPQDVVSFHATLEPLSERPVWVGFELVSVTRGFLAPLPQPIVLDERLPSATMDFVIQTPYHNGYVNESGIAIYRITPRAGSETGEAGSPVVVQLVAHARGAYVPGVEAALLLAAAGVLAAARKLR